MNLYHWTDCVLKFDSKNIVVNPPATQVSTTALWLLLAWPRCWDLSLLGSPKGGQERRAFWFAGRGLSFWVRTGHWLAVQASVWHELGPVAACSHPTLTGPGRFSPGGSELPSTAWHTGDSPPLALCDSWEANLQCGPSCVWLGALLAQITPYI